VTYEFTELNNSSHLGPGPLEFTQPSTYSNELQFGAAMRFSCSTDTFVRYKMRSVVDPLYGFTDAQEGVVYGDAINTNQPTHEDLVEFGGTWTPASNFMLSTTIGIQQRHHNSSYARFDEDDYPITLTAWYAPTCRWTVSGGLGFYSNWIDQDITIGKDHASSRLPGGFEGADSLPFAYGGRSQVINFGTTYACTDRVTLSGGYEHVRSANDFADPSAGALDLHYLAPASDVLVVTNRITGGIDYLIRDGVSAYFRYNYYDYNDASTSGLSGTANFFLGGITATY